MKTLLNKLRIDHYPIQFIADEQYKWSPSNNQVHYDQSRIETKKGVWALLHELGHATLDHKRYSDDLQLLIMEVNAWKEAKQHAKRYGVAIDESYIDECLDSYRQWLHTRSRCIECSNHSLQIDRTTYQCHNCLTKWNVPASRFCAIRRTRVV